MSITILIMPDKRRLERLKEVMQYACPSYGRIFYIEPHPHRFNNVDYCLNVKNLDATNAPVSTFSEDIERMRTFAKGILAGWECPE